MSFQNELMKEKICFLFSLFIALKASAGISLEPGDLLFFSPLIAFVNSFHEMLLSSSVSVGRSWIRSRASSETCFLLLNSFSQCDRMISMFSLSLVVRLPSCFASDMVRWRM